MALLGSESEHFTGSDSGCSLSIEAVCYRSKGSSSDSMVLYVAFFSPPFSLKQTSTKLVGMH